MKSPRSSLPGGPTIQGTTLRAGTFVLLCVVGLLVIPPAFYAVGGLVAASALGTFAVAALVTPLCTRLFEGRPWTSIGLAWNRASFQNLLAGTLGGMGAAGLVVGAALIAGAARWRPDPTQQASFIGGLLLTIILAFGAAGEEMLFRGYAFQILVLRLGPFATILPASLIFGLSHTANYGLTTLGLVNTVGWGILLSLAVLRSGDLWLATGLHFGWNWTLCALGANLSGFEIRLAGHAVEWRVGELWSGGPYGPEAGLGTSVALALLGWYLVRAPVWGQRATLIHTQRGR